MRLSGEMDRRCPMNAGDCGLCVEIINMYFQFREAQTEIKPEPEVPQRTTINNICNVNNDKSYKPQKKWIKGKKLKDRENALINFPRPSIPPDTLHIIFDKSSVIRLKSVETEKSQMFPNTL